jgi:hypothetical protein
VFVYYLFNYAYCHCSMQKLEILENYSFTGFVCAAAQIVPINKAHKNEYSGLRFRL